jgi:hypothetical protein
MSELASILEILSTTANPGIILEFFHDILLAGILIIVYKLLNSWIDYKKEVYKSGLLPDRGKKGGRY